MPRGKGMSSLELQMPSLFPGSMWSSRQGLISVPQRSKPVVYQRPVLSSELDLSIESFLLVQEEWPHVSM